MAEPTSSSETGHQDTTYLTPAEVATRLRVAEPTLRWWRHVGRGPAYVTFGARTIRYERADVDAYARSLKTTPPQIEVS